MTQPQAASPYSAAVQMQREADITTVLTYLSRQNRAIYSEGGYPEYDRDAKMTCDVAALRRLLQDAPAVRESLIARLGVMLHTPITLRQLHGALVECAIAFPIEDTPPAFDPLYDLLDWKAPTAEDVVSALALVGMAHILCDIRNAQVCRDDLDDLDAHPLRDALRMLADDALSDRLDVEMRASKLFAPPSTFPHADTQHCIALLLTLREIANRAVFRFLSA